MTVIDEVTAANERYASSFAGPPAGRPSRGVAVLACMDTRMELLDGLGLAVGEAHWIRNAGGLPTDDALRSLAISQRALGTTSVVLLHHTACGMQGFDDDAFRAQCAADAAGDPPPWRVAGFTDPQDRMRESLALVRACGWLPRRDDVRGFVYDVDTARLTEVDPAD